jgi:hypothetical protein
MEEFKKPKGLEGEAKREHPRIESGSAKESRGLGPSEVPYVLALQPQVEISRESVQIVKQIPKDLDYIEDQLHVANSALESAGGRKAIANAGLRSCSSLTRLLGNGEFWYVLHNRYEYPEIGRQASSDWIAHLNVPATTELLVRLGFGSEDEAKQLIDDARNLFERVIASDSAVKFDSLKLVMAAETAMDRLREQICSHTDGLYERLRSTEEQRRYISVTSNVTGVLAGCASLALQIPSVNRAVMTSAPHVKEVLDQVGRDVVETVTVLGPIAILEYANVASRFFKAPAEFFKLSHKGSEKWGPAGRLEIGSLDERLRILQEQVESADPTLAKRSKASTIIAPRDPVGLLVSIESPTSKRIGALTFPTKYQIIAAPTSFEEKERSESPMGFSKSVSDRFTKSQSETPTHWNISDAEGTRYRSFTTLGVDLRRYRIVDTDDQSSKAYHFKPISEKHGKYHI